MHPDLQSQIFRRPPLEKVVVEVPEGLEVASVRTARREMQIRLEPLADGLIVSDRVTAEEALGLLSSAPRWSFGTFALICTVPLEERSADNVLMALRRFVDYHGLHGSAYWLAPAKDGSKANIGLREKLLGSDFGLPNNPSQYSLTLKLASGEKGLHVLLGPSISVRQRFSYRERDVGASINPVLAAALVRLLPSDLAGTAIDPTCGSGTLLFERLLYSKERRGVGIDVSDVAGQAFKANRKLLPLSGTDIDFRLGSAEDNTNWEACTSVVCNLPFGIRVREEPAVLRKLYEKVLDNALGMLADNGRILMTSSFKSGLEHAVTQAGARAKLLAKYKVNSGGLFYQIFVLSKA